MPPKKDDTPTRKKDDYVKENAVLEYQMEEMKKERVSLLAQNLDYNDRITVLEQEKANLRALLQEKEEQHERDTEDLEKANKHIKVLRKFLEETPSKGTINLPKLNKKLENKGFEPIVREEEEDA